MAIETVEYVRKPLHVSAVQVTDENFVALAMWCQGEIQHSTEYIKVRVHSPKNERQKQAHVGDWILKTKQGYKVYTDKAFKNSFDPVQSPVEEISAAVENAKQEFRKHFRSSSGREMPNNTDYS